MSEPSSSTGMQLAVTCECAFGEQVVAVGGCALLGSWNARKGLVLEWNPGHIWKGTIDKVSVPYITFEMFISLCMLCCDIIRTDIAARGRLTPLYMEVLYS